ncbi:MAG: adenylate/guanylate cyclase domain-containing protein [Syntrophales bacterium]
MNCPKCQFENPEGVKYCGDCGTRLENSCPKCNYINPPQFKFCGDCGNRLEAEPSPREKPLPSTESARKHVTVLFSDMSGYTAMTEKMDPEEVKEVMGKIFGEISKVVAKYGGFIEKFIGDAVMALFGVPKSHEDDPVRAIKASREIHDVVSSLSSQFEKRIGKALCMHTGICTGLVVTGEVNLEKGTHGVLGDTINRAARLSGLAKPGEIVISPDTYYQSEGYFNFEALEPTTVKGKAEPIRPYKVLSAKEDPTKTHRLSGMRAELIGRKVEMAQLQEAVTNLKQGKGSIFSIVGDAGTGKSRLIEEFKASLNLDEFQWREGHAYAYSQNIPYFPLIDLLSRAWQITEGDNPEQVKKKVEDGAVFLISDKSELIPYLGSLYSLKYPEIENVSPEYWKVKLHEAVQLILSALTRRAQTIICIEDLHWADPSSIELLRNILSDFRYPAVFICVYRPTFNLFTSHQAGTIKSYQEIRLYDLSPSDAQSMVESLLKTGAAPGELKKFIRDRVEGNPFYLEEVINSLLETVILVKEDGQWKLTKPLIEANIPSTVQGVISARLDRLETETKRILQEASVIGRAFLYEILKRITELKEQIDRSLMGLERLDLIRTRSFQPDLEYIFKHALTQEVVYNGLLKKERQNIHEKIGQVIEELFKDRLPEFYETLAYHYKQGQSILKAVDYLMKAGEKSLNRYAVEESHQYYKEAFNLLSHNTEKSREEKELLIDLLIDWAVVHNRRASYGEMIDLLKGNEALAISLNDKARLGMFYTHLGHGLGFTVRHKESYRYLHMALELGEETGNEKIIGYACGWLSWTCNDLGLLDESVILGKRVQVLDIYKSEPELFRFSTGGLAIAYWCRGEARKAKETAIVAVDYGQRYHYVPCLAQGYTWLGFSYMSAGDFASAIECGEKAIDAALEPQFVVNAKVLHGWAYLANGQYREASRILQEVNKLAESCGYPMMGEPAKMLSAIVMITEGHIHQGIETIEGLMESNLKSGGRYRYAVMNYQLGGVYLQIAQGGGGKKDLYFLAKNIGFLIKTVPFAHQKAEKHFNIAINTAKEIGAKGVLAQAYFDMGRLRRTKGRTDEARKYISDAIQLFEECEADVFLKQAREALTALG